MDHETGALYSPEGGDLLRVALGLFRVALNLQIASDPASRVLTQEAAEQAVRIVHWILAQLVEAVHSQRTDTLRERIGEFTSLVPVEDFITLRECRRKGFSEAESQQICLLEPRLLELYEHAPPSGGPVLGGWLLGNSTATLQCS